MTKPPAKRHVSRENLDDIEYLRGQIRGIVAVLVYSLDVEAIQSRPDFFEKLRQVVRSRAGERHGDFLAGADETIDLLARHLKARARAEKADPPA